jgi:dihydrofolate synthase/folylpolyglutamate synthase
MRTLEQWLAKIEAGHPTEIDMGLERVSKVAHALNIDFDNTAVITVAGTNGKGTTCRMIEAACVEAGLSSGVYGSPHIIAFNERIRINGKDVSDDQICKAFEQITAAKEKISLTYFEYATLAALLLFTQAKLHVVILEVGLGGRLDATNIVDADISVLTSIGLDHQDYLGDTLEQIAWEKAGIVKANKRCVIGYPEHYINAASSIDALHNQVLKRGVDFDLSCNTTLEEGAREKSVCYSAWLQSKQKRLEFTWSAGHIPPSNIITALASLSFLTDVVDEKLSQADVLRAKLVALLNDGVRINALIKTVTLPGRAQMVSLSPLIMLDVAHNEAAAQYLCEKIGTFEFSRCHIVVGMLKDKNIEETIVALSGIDAHWYCADLPGPRGEKHQRLLRAIPDKNHEKHKGFANVESALHSAIEQASNTDMIVVVGSFVTVADATKYLTRISLIGNKELAHSQ